ncbi:MAG: hypothetical protein ABFC56_00720 [Clostridiaceae bacterium]
MHSPIVIRHVNMRGKRLEQKSQELPAEETSVALSDLPESAPLQTLDPTPPSEQVEPHPPRKRKPYGLAIAAAMLVFAPFLFAVNMSAFGLILVGDPTLIVFLAVPLLGIPLSNVGSLLLYLSSRAANYMRKPVILVSLELLVLQIGSSVIYSKNIRSFEFDFQSLKNPLLAIVLASLILLCMIVLCVFSVLMLVRLLPKRPAKKTPA